MKSLCKLGVLLLVCLLLAGLSVTQGGANLQKQMYICLDYQVSQGCYNIENDVWMENVEAQLKHLRLKEMDRMEMPDAFTQENVHTVIGIMYLDVGEPPQQEADGTVYQSMELVNADQIVICKDGAVCVMHYEDEQMTESYYQSADTDQLTAWLQDFGFKVNSWGKILCKKDARKKGQEERFLTFRF